MNWKKRDMTSHHPTKHPKKKTGPYGLVFFFKKKCPLALSLSAVMFSSVFQFLFARTL